MPFTPSYVSSAPLVHQSLRIWAQVRRHFGWQAGSLWAPIASNHRFAPSFHNDYFSAWQKKGIISFKDMYITGVFASFEQLKTKFNLRNVNFFSYLQVRDWARNNTGMFPTIPEPQAMDSLFPADPELSSTISVIYTKLSSVQSESLDALRGVAGRSECTIYRC